jgi:hypothetical protein
MNNTAATATTTPARAFADGQAVTFTEGSRGIYTNTPATVESAMLVGVRHPGWIYTLRRADGRPVYTAEGLIDAVRT